MPADDMPLVATDGKAIMLVGRANVQVHLHPGKPSVQYWHAFFAYMDTVAPKGACVASRSAETFEYMLQVDPSELNAQAAVDSMAKFAIDMIRYSDKCKVTLRLGMAVGPCTSAFTGNVLRFGVFGPAVDEARIAADGAHHAQGSTRLLVTEDVAVLANKRTYAVCHQTDRMYNLTEASPTSTSTPPKDQPYAASHPLLLFYNNRALEHSFTLHHNGMCIATERIWMCIGVLMCFIYARSMLSADQPELPLMGATIAFLALEALTLAQSLFMRSWFMRYREKWAMMHRLTIFVLVCLASRNTQGLEQVVFGYGAPAMLMNALGHKIRFHLQLLLSVVTAALGLCWMAYDQHSGVVDVPHVQPYVLVLVGVVLPALLVWRIDSSSRRAFALCKMP